MIAVHVKRKRKRSDDDVKEKERQFAVVQPDGPTRTPIHVTMKLCIIMCSEEL
jgi:hypothetical protein